MKILKTKLHLVIAIAMLFPSVAVFSDGGIRNKNGSSIERIDNEGITRDRHGSSIGRVGKDVTKEQATYNFSPIYFPQQFFWNVNQLVMLNNG
jgi:hypothetical protein